MHQTMIAMSAGTAMRAFTGIWMPGMTSHRLLKSTKKKIVVRNGSHDMACGPMVCTRIVSRTNSTPASAAFCTPVGTSLALRPARKNSVSVKIDDSSMSSVILLNAK